MKQGDAAIYEIPFGIKDNTVSLGGIIPIGEVPPHFSNWSSEGHALVTALGHSGSLPIRTKEPPP